MWYRIVVVDFIIIRKTLNKGVMATGTSRSSRWWIRAPARLVPAPYPQRCAEKVRLEAASSKRPPKNHRRLQTSTRYNRLCGIRRHGHTDGSPLLAMSTSTAPAAWAAGVAYRFRSILSFRPLPFDVPSGFGFCDSAGDSVLAIQICRALLGFRLVAEHPGSVEAASVMPD